MTCNEIDNLIDLSNDGEITPYIQKQIIDHDPSITLINKPSADSTAQTSVIYTPLNDVRSHRRESLDNNPFDVVQKLANRPEDPFEIVEKEACEKARSLETAGVEVKLGNLLSLSDDNLLEDEIDGDKHVDSVPHSIQTQEFPIHNSDADLFFGDSMTKSIYKTCNELDKEQQSAHTPDNANFADSDSSAGSADSSATGKSKKALEYRKRLLKLSLSNSAFNSPVSRRNANDSSFAIFSEAAQSCDHMLAAESPLKLVDDDLMSEEPHWIEEDFDADLEMLQIPMLHELPSPVVDEQETAQTRDVAITETIVKVLESPLKPFTDLAAIRTKLQAKRVESNSTQDISELINSLKSLICDINVGDAGKKLQARCLLDTLSSAFTACKNETPSAASTESKDATLAPPQPIVRQGTFDIELQEKDEQLNAANVEPTVAAPSDEFPDVMIKSSATYDGETADEKQDLILPVVEPLPPPTTLSQTDVDMNDIVEQLGRLLEQHQINRNMQADKARIEGSTHSASVNPTFIVVMNTSHAPAAPPTAKQRSSYVASYLENSVNDGSPDLSYANSTARRRSQSLSIHDKVKVVQMPMLPPSVLPILIHEPHGQTPTATTPPLDAEAVEFKTPSRMMLRRNSFTSGTPFTPMMQASAQRRASGITDTATRRGSVLATHHERQQPTPTTSTATAAVRPMPQMNLNAIKPELNNKKRLKSSCSSDSILKACGPMKATIPVKKVAPMLKTTTPPTPDIALNQQARGSMNTSMHLLTKAGKMSYTSTPMPPARATANHDASGFPNACSTPTVRASPMKRLAVGATKPRYSYLSATPTAKPTAAASAAAANLRRRTITEFKAKSPIKPRVSTGVSGAAAAGKAAVARGALKLPQSTTRNVSKQATTAKPSTRLSTRASTAGTAAANNQRNKENKHP